jgi:signal transduction histidine kinase
LRKFDLEFRNKHIQVETELSQDGTPVLADREKLSQVVENLLKNALQYTPEGGSISVRTESLSEIIKFFVGNSGPGIEAKDLPFIFERFYRGEKSRSRDFGGTGIGLAIVKEIMEAHGGEIGVESVPGKTLFWLSLPRYTGGNREA